MKKNLPPPCDLANRTPKDQIFRALGLFISSAALLLATSQPASAASVTYTMQDANFPTQFNSGGDFFNNGATELGMWANSGAKQTVAWQNFSTTGAAGGTARTLQIGDTFVITVAATRASGQIGFSLNANGTQGTSYANNISGSRLYVNTDNYGSWYVGGLSGAATSSLSYTPIQNVYKDYRFTIKLTSQSSADVFLTVDGTDYRASNLNLGGTAGVNINAFSIYGSDMYDGSTNQNAYWKQTSTLTNSGSVELGYYLTSGSSTTPGVVSDGLAADSTSTASVNAVNIGGDSGSAVILNQSNTYTGATTVNTNATARAQHANAFGTTAGGVTVSSGGMLELSGNITIGAEALTLNGTGVSSGGALRNTSGNNTWTGAITLAANARINSEAGTLIASSTVAGGSSALFAGGVANTVFSGAISGAGAVLASHGNTTTSFFKDGVGAVTLSASNTFSGATLLNAGTILIGNNAAFGSGFLQVHYDSALAKTLASTDSNARTISNELKIYNDITLGAVDRTGGLTFSGATTLGDEVGNRTLTAATGTSHTFSGNITGLRGIIKEGAGTLVFSGSNNTFSGGLQLRTGTVSMGANTALGVGTVLLGNGTSTATLAFTDNATLSQSVSVLNASTAGAISVASGKTATLSALAQTGSTDTTKFGKTGAGTLSLGGTSTYAGQIQVGEGTVIATSNSALGTNSGTINRGIDLGLNVGDTEMANNVAVLLTNGVTNNNSIYVAPNTSGATRTIGLSGAGTATFSNEMFLNGNLTIAGGSGTVEITGNILNSGGVVASSGTVLLTGNKTYTGATTVTGATLRANGSLAGAVTVNSGTLGGNATIGGLATLNSGATLSPGNSVGTMTFNNGLTLNSGGNVTMEITGTSTFDKINVTAGNIIYGGTLYLALGGYTPAANATFDLFDGIRSGSTTFTSIVFSNPIYNSGATFDYTTGIVTVPEPSTWALLAIGTSLILWRLRCRKNRAA